MKKEQLRSTIEFLEARVSQATTDVLEQQQSAPSPADDESLPPPTFSEIQTGNVAIPGEPAANIVRLFTTLLTRQDPTTTYEIKILTRPLKSLKYANSIIPRRLYPAFSAKYGITHWAVEVGDRIFEVRTEGWKGKNGKMTIREEDSRRPEYTAADVRRYTIGIGSSGALNEFRRMGQLLQTVGVAKYHFWSNNCQLIAAAMAVAGCQIPADGWKTLVFRDDLRFFNSNNPGDVLSVLDAILPEEQYYHFLKAVEMDYNRRHERQRLARRSSMSDIRMQARFLWSVTVDYTVYSALFPFAVMVMLIEKALEQPDWNRRITPAASGSIIPDNLFGIQSKSHHPRPYSGNTVYWRASTPRSISPSDSARERSGQAPPAYSPTRPPSYFQYDWHDQGIQDSNERWICAMYGYGDC